MADCLYHMPNIFGEKKLKIGPNIKFLRFFSKNSIIGKKVFKEIQGKKEYFKASVSKTVISTYNR